MVHPTLPTSASSALQLIAEPPVETVSICPVQALSVPFRLSIIRNEGHMHIYDISLVVLFVVVAVGVVVAVVGVAVVHAIASFEY